jgi:hypothetical protein
MTSSFRYKLYGFKPAEHDDNNTDTNSHHQNLTKVVLVYETDNKDEAKKLVSEGGFVSPTLGYVVIQGAKDVIDGGSIGLIPEGIL